MESTTLVAGREKVDFEGGKTFIEVLLIIILSHCDEAEAIVILGAELSVFTNAAVPEE